MHDGAGGKSAELAGEDEAFREAVRRTAYFLWEQDGRPGGRDEDYYLRALEMHRRQVNYDAWLRDGPVDAAPPPLTPPDKAEGVD